MSSSTKPRSLVPAAILLVMAVLAPHAGTAADAASAAAVAKPFAACLLEHPLKLGVIEAECAELRVPESAARNGRWVTLSVVRVPAINRNKQPDPIVLIAGGPGMGTQGMYSVAPSAFSRARRDRDILLVDQRGTGRSTPLTCPSEADDPFTSGAGEGNIAEFIKAVVACRDSLAKDHDLRAFTTSRAVRDLDLVRGLLGYEQINLYGVSYGTRVAQHYARRYPNRVRSMVLDGVLAPATVLGPAIALDAQSALDGILRRCRENDPCREAFGDPVASLAQVQGELKRGAKLLRVSHPRTGAEQELRFGSGQLAAALRLSSYEPMLAAMLPLVIHQASRGDYRPFATLFLLTTTGVVDSMAAGMHNSVVCSEDLPRLDATGVDRKALASTYIGTDLIDGLREACAVWPSGEVDEDFHQPLKSDVPTLLLSGTLDPVTPPAGAALVAKSLSRSTHSIFKDSGHGQLGVTCIDRVFSEFFAKADPKSIDTRCLSRWSAPPFWTSLAGPPP